MVQQTIAGIATPIGTGGIGIIRISGPNAYHILQRLFVLPVKAVKNKSPYPSGLCFRSRQVYYGHIVDPVTEHIFDEVLVIFMKGPKSYTREDIVEIHSHSGFVVLDRILNAVVDSGATLSRPGAFTKRAFLNGRIDLTQAEAIIDLINAPCETAAQIASQQIAGGFRDVSQKIITALVDVQAKCEASLEFGEELGDDYTGFDLVRKIRASILPEIQKLIRRQKETSIFQEGFHLAIAGVPNVGKSSLLNQLVEREAAIVSDVPGTTRDIVREFISIDSVPVVVCDTAGIQETVDPVECIGVAKARDQIKEADIVLLVLDGSRGLNPFELGLIDDLSRSRLIIVINKDDIANPTAISSIKKVVESKSYISVSAKNGTNIDSLKKIIFKDMVLGKNTNNGSWVTPNLRQRKILEKANKMLLQIVSADERGREVELFSEKITSVLGLFGDISGNREKEDLYDSIFNQFCVGK